MYSGPHVKLDKKIANNGHVTQLLERCHAGTCDLYLRLGLVWRLAKAHKDKTRFKLEKLGNSKSKYSNFGQKTPNIGTFFSAIL